jgi:hypothetical protein
MDNEEHGIVVLLPETVLGQNNRDTKNGNRNFNHSSSIQLFTVKSKSWTG